VSIEAMQFLRPIAVGDEVFCYCTLVKEGGTSVTVRIETWARERGSKASEKVTEGVFTPRRGIRMNGYEVGAGS
jgi:acyl-CoA thioesterase YciA